jgi:hypothetical protein
MLEGPVVSTLGFRWKTAGRQLSVAQMISQTITANSFSGAGFIAAIAVLRVLCLLAFHVE